MAFIIIIMNKVKFEDTNDGRGPQTEVDKAHGKYSIRGMLLSVICFVLLVSIAVLAIVTYCTFSRTGGKYIRRDEFISAMASVSASSAPVERDGDNNAVWHSISGKYVVICLPAANADTCANHTVYVNGSGTAVGNGWYIADMDGIAHICSTSSKQCVPANISAAYDSPEYIQSAVIRTGDARYLKTDDVLGYAAGDKVLSEASTRKAIDGVSSGVSEINSTLARKADNDTVNALVDEIVGDILNCIE